MSISLARRHQRGLTMIELLAFIVIVGIAVAGILSVLGYTTKNSADPQMRKQALVIAEGLLEEVALARFTYCDPNDTSAANAYGAFITPQTGSTVPPESVGCATTVETVGHPVGAMRPYSNVNDYVTQFDVPQAAFDQAGALSDATGNPIGIAGYTVTLAISAKVQLGPTSSPVPTDLITSTDAPAPACNPASLPCVSDTMNVLHMTVTVTYNGGRDSVVLEGYRTRYAPNSLP